MVFDFKYSDMSVGFIHKNKIKMLAVTIACILLVSTTSIFHKIAHQTDPEARCLDGSPAALYLDKGSSTDILFYFQGGAMCGDVDLGSTIQSCYQRSKTNLGSSLRLRETIEGQGILSADPSKNKFANWTKVIIVYCDGAFHQGYSKIPLKYKDISLYFRGTLNTKSHFQYINNELNFANSDNVIITGSSAGGIATFIWADYLKSLLPNPKTKFFSIPQSGIFLNPDTQLRRQSINGEDPMFNLLQISNMDDSVPNKECGSALGKDLEWNCLTIRGALPFLKSESLFIQSSYDQYVIRYGGNITCLVQGVSGFSLVNCNSKQMKVIEDYRSFYMEYLNKVLKAGHSIWTISCSWHAVIWLDAFYNSPLQKVPVTQGRTMEDAVIGFMKGQKIVDIDLQAWPSNSACAY